MTCDSGRHSKSGDAKQAPSEGCQSGGGNAASPQVSQMSSPHNTRGVEEMRQKLRMIISHASGGHLSEPGDVDRSVNDICVEISRHHTRVWEHAQESALKARPEAVTDELIEALTKIKAGSALGKKMFEQRVNERKGRLTWYAVNVLQDNLDACFGTADAALSKVSPLIVGPK